MAVIPIDPSSIAGAVNYTAPLVATNMNLCKAPPEGLRCIPMQFSFANNPAWVINMQSVSPSQPFSQLCALFVDTSQCQYDVNIIFPDTGYQRRIPFGDSVMIPVLTGKTLPTFYVVSDSGGAASSDVVNVIAVNQFLPESLLEEFKRIVSYGYGGMKQLFPVLAQSQTFAMTVEFNTLATIINASQWYITAINIRGVYTCASAQDTAFDFQFYDGDNILLDYVFGVFANANQVIDTGILTDVAGLNIVSSGAGPLKAALVSGGGGAFSNGGMRVNICGGILVA